MHYNRARAFEIQRADIIFTTCVSVRRNMLLEALWTNDAPQIGQVILDEAAQCMEPEAICPMAVARKANAVVMLGDHCQLRPSVQSAVSARAGLDVSLFERLALQGKTTLAGSKLTLLDVQYRMHPSISRFPCKRFYGGLVHDAPCTKQARAFWYNAANVKAIGNELS